MRLFVSVPVLMKVGSIKIFDRPGVEIGGGYSILCPWCCRINK